MRQGVIPSHMIETMVASGQILVSSRCKTIKCSPQSLDLRLGTLPTGCAHPFSLDTLQRSQSGCVNLRCIELTCRGCGLGKGLRLCCTADGGARPPGGHRGCRQCEIFDRPTGSS